MIELLAALMIIFLLSGISVMIRRGLNQIIRGLESLDQRLANIERVRDSDPRPLH